MLGQKPDDQKAADTAPAPQTPAVVPLSALQAPGAPLQVTVSPPEDVAGGGGEVLAAEVGSSLPTDEVPAVAAESATTEMQELRARMLLCKKMLAGPVQDGSSEEPGSPMASDERLQRELLVRVKQRDSEIRGLRENLEMLERTKTTMAAAVGAAGGAAALGTAGATAGLAVGGAVGAAVGIAPAAFTLGVSIPISGFLGAGCGLLMGSATGVVAGVLSGGALGVKFMKSRAGPHKDLCPEIRTKGKALSLEM